MRIQKRKTRFLAGVLVMGTVAGAVAGSALLSPAPQASAEGGTGSSAETEVQLNLLPTLSVTASDVNITITPTDNGSYQTGTSSVSVDSNAANGYKVYVSTKTAETALTHGNSSITKKISAVDADTAVSTYETSTAKNNTWGYVHDKDSVSTISPIPYEASPSTAAFGEGDSLGTTNFTLTIGVKADKTIPSGDYSNTVVITAVPNA